MTSVISSGKILIVELMGYFMHRKKNLAEFTPACCRQVLLVIKLVKGFTYYNLEKSRIKIGGACLDEFYQNLPLVPMGKFGKVHPNKHPP